VDWINLTQTVDQW